MALAQVQALLARIYTDAEVRERFFAAPRQVGAEFGLTEEEARQLGQMSEGRARFFAESLARKRAGGVRRLLPLTSRTLGRQFTELFGRHTVEFLPRGHGKAHQDAVAFASFLGRMADDGGVVPSLAGLARYEASRLLSTDPARRLTICWLPALPEDLVQGADLGTEAHGKVMRPVIAVWFRPTARSRVRQVALPIPRRRSSDAIPAAPSGHVTRLLASPRRWGS